MDHKVAFRNSSYHKQLRQEIGHNYRLVGHALDNYGVSMEDELKEALERLQRATKEVLECIR